MKEWVLLNKCTVEGLSGYPPNRPGRIILKDRESDLGGDAPGLESSISNEFECYKRE